MTINTDIPDKVAGIVKDLLTERFRDEFVFHPIVVRPEIDHDGDEYLEIYVVFDGDQKNLDPGWTLGLSGRIWPEVEAMGVPGVPEYRSSKNPNGKSCSPKGTVNPDDLIGISRSLAAGPTRFRGSCPVQIT